MSAGRLSRNHVVGLGIDDPVWVPTVFTKNRDRLLTTDMSRKVLAAIEDPQRPHALRVHMQMLDFRTRKIHPQPTPSNAGTKHLNTQGIANGPKFSAT